MYFVDKIEECARCGGKGIVPNPEWQRFWEAHNERFPNGAPTEQASVDFHDAWWEAKGVDPLHTPSEMELCPDCEGLQRFEERVPLREALKELLREALKEVLREVLREMENK